MKYLNNSHPLLGLYLGLGVVGIGILIFFQNSQPAEKADWQANSEIEQIAGISENEWDIQTAIVQNLILGADCEKLKEHLLLLGADEFLELVAVLDQLFSSGKLILDQETRDMIFELWSEQAPGDVIDYGVAFFEDNHFQKKLQTPSQTALISDRFRGKRVLSLGIGKASGLDSVETDRQVLEVIEGGSIDNGVSTSLVNFRIYADGGEVSHDRANWVAELQNVEVKLSGLNTVMKIWGSTEPLSASQWLDTQSKISGQIETELTVTLAQIWSESDPQSAILWLMQNEQRAGISVVVGSWAERDLRESGDFLNSIEKTSATEMDVAVFEYSQKAASVDVEVAQTWVDSIEDSSLRSVAEELMEKLKNRGQDNLGE
ncbi:MAG: hypothetical protein AAF558_08630 [Verrucomicrobiota bacterium]